MRSPSARAHGVHVHVLLDWVGSQKMEPALLQEMESAGVEVHRYHPLHWYHLTRLNNRTHRKLLVVDGSVGFTGGVGIGDEWDGNAADSEHWRDSHYRLEGPAVAQMQAAFMDNWIKTTGRALHGAGLLPCRSSPSARRSRRSSRARRRAARESMQLMYLLSITAAEKTIDLAAAYFVPGPADPPRLLSALAARCPRAHHHAGSVHRLAGRPQGVARDVGTAAAGGRRDPRVPAHDVPLQGADRRRQLVSVGSTNFDNRSFRLNDEANLNIYDRDFAERVERIFEADLQRSRRVTYEAWLARPWQERLLEKLSADVFVADVARRRSVPGLQPYDAEALPCRCFHHPPGLHLLDASCAERLEPPHLRFDVVAFDVEMDAARMRDGLDLDMQAAIRVDETNVTPALASGQLLQLHLQRRSPEPCSALQVRGIAVDDEACQAAGVHG